MKSKKQIILIAVAAVVVLTGGIAIYSQKGDRPSINDTSETTGEVAPKTKFTEEEKAALESQTGVTVLEDGVVEVNVGERQAEEESVTIKRSEAESLVQESMSGETEILSAGLQNQEGTTYWIVRADKGGEAYQVWIDAETGQISRSQRE